MLKSKGRSWLLALVSIFIASTGFAQNLRISGGNGHSVVICANGTVFAWGKNDVGQLGLQTNNVTPYGGAFSSTPRQVGGLGQIFQIDAGSGSHTLALTCQGKVYAWGANLTNQLGNNTAAPGGSSATPVLVKGGVTGTADLSGVKYVSGGNDESFALLVSKRVVSWGENDKGQLGDGTTINRAAPVYVINGITGLPLENVKQIEAGDENGYALLEDGTVWSWGEPVNSKALGRVATDPSRAHPVQLQDGSALSGIKEISAGDRHGLAITDGGQLYSWGGDWGQGQLGQGPAYQDVAYASRVVGGASGETFLGISDPVISVAAGQAHSMATTASGKVYTWGSNGFFLTATPTPAGQLGVGTANGIATNPVYFVSQTGPNQSPMLALNGAAGFTNAISVSDGDAWSFVLTGDGKLYVSGYNVEGQLGIAGNTTNQYTFTELSIPSCGVITPCPTLDLGLDLNYCLPFTVTLDAGLIYPGFTVDLYKNDVLQPGSVVRPWTLGGGPINVSFPISTYANEWKIEIVDMRTSTQRPCTPCVTAKDSLSILPYASNFGDPGNLTFCGTTSTVNVTETGSSATTIGSTYEWYAAQTAGSILATTTDVGTAALDVTTLVKTGVAPNRIATVWVEDKSTFNAILATTAQVGASILDPNGKSGNQSRMTFSIAKALKINTIRINLRSYDATALTWSFGIYNSAGVLQGTNVPFTAGVATGNTWATVDFNGLSLTPGNYYIQYINGNSGVSFYTNPGNAYTALYQYNGQTIIDFISTDNPGVTTYFPAYVDWNVTVGSPYPCGRLAVLITEKCPPCNKPTSVTVNGGTSPINKCVGDPAFTTSGSYINAGNPIANTSMAYVWYKQGAPAPTTAEYTNLTAPAPVTTTASQTVTARNFTAPVVGDAGTWILRVEDGNTGNALCYTEGTVVLNVNPLPTITGTLNVCIASTTQLTGSGTAATITPWVSGTPAVATVSSTGLVSGVTAGTSVITYTNNNGCIITATVTVNALPTITGTLTACVGATTQLTGSGTAAAVTPWVSATPAVATVSATGLVTGVAAGTSVITYTNNNGCKITATVTINALPTITGTLSACIGATTQLTGSGTAAAITPWVSATPAVATVSATGLVTGVAVGTSDITYTNNNGCKITATVTINALPTITGTLSACIGVTTQLTGSGTAAAITPWVSATPAVATVSATGLVTGVALGTSDITYTNNNGCKITATVTINALPTITGTLSACIGATTQLSGSGTAAAVTPWVSATPAVATVSATGLVTGVAAGTSVITYTNNNGCKITATVTTNALPTITGTLSACIGATTLLTGSGTAAAVTPWVSATPAVATVSATGLVTGVAVGTSDITYTNNNGCKITATVTVNPLPTITGTLNVCIASTTQLTGSGTAASSNAWVSGTLAVATVSSTGLVTGATAGTSVITYTNNNGCAITATVTVNALPTITGTLSACVGLTTQLTGSATAAAAAAWVSTTPAVATVDNAGLVTGVSAGTSVITYTNSNGCKITATVTINALPTITGTLSVCIGSTTTLTGSGTPNGTTPWTSASTAIATITNAGVVTGVSAGTSVITYTTSAGCIKTATVTVNPKPTITSAATGTTCTGVALNYLITSDIPSSYSWVRSPSVANPAPSGASTANPITETLSSTTAVNVVYTITPTSTTGSCPGTPFTYTVAVSATAAPTVAITPSKNPICAGENVTFTTLVGAGGTPTYKWTSSASVPTSTVISTTSSYASSALVNGEVISVEITSSLGCAVPSTATNSITMTVNPIPAPSVSITVNDADRTICPNTSITFTAAPTAGGTPPGYVWKKNNVAITPAETGSTYTTTGAVDGDIYTVEMVSSALCAPTAPATSNPITITVTPVPTISVTITPTSGAICSGQPFFFTATATSSGSTAATTYEWFITSDATSGTSNAVSQGAPSTTATSLSTSALTATKNKVYVQVVSNATCASIAPVASNVATITVTTGIGAGTIGADQTICYNGIPVPLTQLTAATGVTAAATYTWEISSPASGGPYTLIPGSGTGYTFPAIPLTQDVYIRRVVTDASLPGLCNTATSMAVHITVRPQLVVGVIGTSAITCFGAVTTTMSETTAPTGGNGTYTYQWQSAPDAVGAPGTAGTFSNITTGGTGATYNAGALTSTTYYQLIESSCGESVTTNIVTKKISAPEVITAVIDNAPSQVCASAASIVFTATGSSSTGPGTLSYQWYFCPVSPANAVGMNSSTYTYTPVKTTDSGKQVNLVVTTSNGCNSGPGTATPYVLDIVGSVTPKVAITTLNNPNCAGLLSTFTATSTGGGTSPGPSYQWYVNNIQVGTGGTTYSSSTLAPNAVVYVDMTSSSTCLAVGVTNPTPSNKIIMVIKPIPTPSITQGDQTVCSPNGFTFNGNVTPGNSYEWRQVPGNVVVGTGVDFTATQSGTYRLYEDNGTCNTASDPVNLTVIQTPIANAGADVYMKEGDVGNLNGSGGAVYSWSPATYLSSAAVSNPSFPATQTITYTLTVSDATNTCSTTDDVTIFVVKPVKVPNVITVNGDGSNDDWEIENIEGYPNVIIEIYNRWGNLVWKTEGYPKNWDGTNFRNGQVLPDGTYFYIINLQSQIYDEPLTGWVQIIK